MDYPNWFETVRWEGFDSPLLQEFKDKPITALQIGAYTGDASLWLMENILTHPDSVLYDVDTWEGSDEPIHKEFDWEDVFSTYEKKLDIYLKDRRVHANRCTSDEYFKSNTKVYDFIYIDGDHTAYGVIKDIVSAFEVLAVGGIMALDDYEWQGGATVLDNPKPAINAFLSIYSDRIDVLVQGYQVWVRRTR